MEAKPQLGLVIDSWSLEQTWMLGEKLVGFNGAPLLKWVRSPLQTSHEELKSIPEYKIVGNSEMKEVEIEGQLGTARYAFFEQANVVTELTKELCGKADVSREETETVRLAFIFLALSKFETDYQILVTQRPLLLRNRLLLRTRLGKRLRLIAVDEALEIVDLFCRKNGCYYIRPPLQANQGYWYWLSFRSRIPRFHVSGTILDALGTRLVYLLMSLDEIGIQHYSEVNNDTMDRAAYHFNYFLMLPGIFDSLALTTRERLGITFERDDIPQRTSLSNKTGEDFLRALREKRPDIRKHISAYVDYINLIYEMRELVIHREGLAKAGYKADSPDKRWEANIVDISPAVMQYIKACGDAPSDFDPFSRWGVFSFSSKFLLVPYPFAKMATEKLGQFVNSYLEMLGFTNFVESLPEHDDFREDMKNFSLTR